MLKNKFFIPELIIVIFLTAIDLITKQLAVKYLSEGSFTIIPKVLSFTLLEGGNSGAAFGLLSGGFWLFFVITIVVLTLVISTLRKLETSRRYLPIHVALVILIAGALGNFADRTLTMFTEGRSYVIDFIYFEFINFPIFNVADCYVTIAAVIILLFGFIYYKDEDYNKIFSFKHNKRQDKDGNAN